MIKDELEKTKRDKIIMFCIALIIVSLNLGMSTEVSNEKVSYNTSYKMVNTKNMATTKVSVKTGTGNTVVEEIKKITNPTQETTSSPKIEAISLKTTKEEIPVPKEPEKPIWRLPTEQGIITQYPSYGHVALDITSRRGIYETIYPIADGTISSIYLDFAGAKIVTVNHNINGTNYTSQYVHMSSYAPGIYVGQPVTTDTPLGQMGSTGISTGNHLHISVADCSIFDPNDQNCRDLNGFFRYLRARYTQGFRGLNSIIPVPWSWSSR